MEVSLLHFDGCPSWEQTDQRLREAVSLARVPVLAHPVGLSCRVFRTPDRLRAGPTIEQLVAVLR